MMRSGRGGAWCAGALAVASCAARGGEAGGPAVPATAATAAREAPSRAPGAPSAEAAVPEGMSLQRGAGWSIAVPERWGAAPAPNGARFRPDDLSRRGGELLQVDVGVVPTSGGEETLRRVLDAASTAEGIEPIGQREFMARDARAAEVVARQSAPRSLAVIMGRVAFRGRAFANVRCVTDAPAPRLTQAACQHALDSLVLAETEGAPAPAPRPGERWIGGQGRFVSVPAASVDHVGAPNVIAEVELPRAGDGAEVVVSLVGASMRLTTAADLLPRMRQEFERLYTADGSPLEWVELPDPPLRVVEFAGTMWVTPRPLLVVRRALVLGSRGAVLQCVARSTSPDAVRARCAPILDSFRFEEPARGP